MTQRQDQVSVLYECMKERSCQLWQGGVLSRTLSPTQIWPNWLPGPKYSGVVFGPTAVWPGQVRLVGPVGPVGGVVHSPPGVSCTRPAGHGVRLVGPVGATVHSLPGVVCTRPGGHRQLAAKNSWEPA